MAKRWLDQPAAVLASGPSLTKHQIELVKQSNIKTIAINTTWESAPFCDVIYAGDFAWWLHNVDRINVSAERWTCSRPAQHKFDAHFRQRRITPTYNTGLLGIELAHWFGASTIFMLGFDASLKNGVHHHGLHTKTPNPTKQRCAGWVNQAENLKRILKSDDHRATIYNCSPQSAIDSFPKRDLEAELCALGLI